MVPMEKGKSHNSGDTSTGELVGIATGLYTGRLRNNSECSERFAHERDKSVNKDSLWKKGERQSRTKYKVKSSSSEFTEKARSKSLKSPSKPHSPGIRRFLSPSPHNPFNKHRHVLSQGSDGETTLTKQTVKVIRTKSASPLSIDPPTAAQTVRSDKTTAHQAVNLDDNYPLQTTDCNSSALQVVSIDKGVTASVSNTYVRNMTTPGSKVDTQQANIKEQLQSTADHNRIENNERMMSEDEKQILADKEAIKNLEQRLENLKEGTMERMLLEMQLDSKRGNLKTRKAMCMLIDKSLATQKEMNRITAKCEDMTSEVNGVKTLQSEQATEMQSLENDLSQVRDKVSILTGIVQRQAMMIQHLQEANEDAERKRIKNNIIIQGLDVGANDTEQDIRELVTDFFSQTMKIRRNIAIKSVLWLHRADNGNTAIQVTLSNIRDKGLIFKNIGKIIGVKNNNDNNYYVNDHLTFERQEDQRRFRSIKKNNNNLQPTDCATIKFKKGELYINNEKYLKKVSFPNKSETISPDSKENIDKIYMTEGEFIQNGKYKFVAMSQEVTCINDVRCGYIKVRRAHPKALHIACAYYLPGATNHYSKDDYDCGEYGAGRTLLDVLTKTNIVHRAIYAARYYGGSKIGPSCFESYKDAAISAISHSSYNSKIKKNQFPFSGNQSRSKHGDNKRDQTGYARAASPVPYSVGNQQIERVSTPTSSPNAAFSFSDPWKNLQHQSWEDCVEDGFRERTNSFPSLPSKPVTK